MTDDEEQIRRLIERWAEAVHGGDLSGVRGPLRRQVAALMTSYGKIVSAAVENGLDWLIHTFGNESAAREVKEKWREKEG